MVPDGGRHVERSPGIVAEVIDHVTLRVADKAVAERFYDTVLAPLGVARAGAGDDYAEWDNDFSVAQADADHPRTANVHVAFFAPSHDEVRAFWRAGVDAGYDDDGEPGPRPQYTPEYFGGFLRDPDGNSAEAVYIANDRRRGAIDHVWIRVADVAAARDFYQAIAPYAGFRLSDEEPGRVQFRTDGASFSFISDEQPVSEHVHVAFATADDGAVEVFHRVATEAGHRDNGAPGERPEYHPGYYAAYVLDPDGNNVEVVNHRR